MTEETKDGQEVAAAANFAAATEMQKKSLLEEIHALLAAAKADGKEAIEWPVEKFESMLKHL